MVKVELPEWEGFEKYIKESNIKEIKIQLQHDDNNSTVRIIGDNATLGSMTISGNGNRADFLRMRVKKERKFPFILESFEVNAGLWKGKFKRT